MKKIIKMRKNKLSIGGILLMLSASLLFNSCKTIPANAAAVKPFDKEKYLGKWYEIARLDNRFEKNMNNVTANYSLNEDGTIKVLNQGFNYVKNENASATGRAKFVGATDEAKLKVSFFGPFYSGYNVIAVDDEYKYALVFGKNLKYLWILSREKTLPEEIKTQFIEIAQKTGYDTDALLWVEHN